MSEKPESTVDKMLSDLPHDESGIEIIPRYDTDTTVTKRPTRAGGTS